MSHETEIVERQSGINARARAAAADAFHRQRQGEADAAHQAALISTAAERLATATRAWRTLAPATRAEIDTIGTQLEGMRIALGNLRIASQGRV